MSSLNLQDWQSIISIAAIAFSAVAFLGVLWLQARFVTRKEIEAAQTARAGEREKEEALRKAERETFHALINAQDRRLLALELSHKNLPSAQQLHELSLQLTRVEGEMQGLSIKLDSTNERVDHLNGTVERHESIFSNNARGGA